MTYGVQSKQTSTMPKLRLEIEIDYYIEDEASDQLPGAQLRREVDCQLLRIARHAADNGLFSGDLPVEATTWGARVVAMDSIPFESSL